MSRRRWIEALKTAALCLLLVSAGILCWQNWFSSAAGGSGEEDGGLPQVVSSAAAAQPLAAGIFERQSAYGAAFQAEETGVIMDLWGDLLGECLSTAETTHPCSQERWQEVLSGRGLYLRYAAALPLDALCLWQGYAPGESLSGQRGQRLFLSVEEESLALYYGQGSQYRCCATGVSRNEWERISTGTGENNASFLFHNGREQLVLSKPVVHSEIERVSFTGGEEALMALVRPFHLSAYSNNRYSGPQGNQVFVEGARTLRLETDGRGSYQDRGTEHGDWLQAAGNTPGEEIEVVRALAQQVLDPFLGDAVLSLSGYESAGEKTVIRFQLTVDGVPVYDGQTAFEARLEQGVVTQADFLLRGYRKTDRTLRALPLVQAASLSQQPLFLWYLPGENGWTLTWIEQSE